MSDGNALLRAILDNPDDDAPRLIYADWLEEHGDPDRATFIRAQIELACLPPDHPDRDRLVQTERTLWKANRAAWTAWVPGWVKSHEFRRGFLEMIRCDAGTFVSEAVEIRSRAPILSVRLETRMSLAEPLFFCRGLNGLREVRFSLPIHRGDWVHLARSPYFGCLLSLEIASSAHADELIFYLTRSLAFPMLRSLRLRSFPLGDELTARLVGHVWSGRLRTLDLGRNEISSAGAQALVDSPHLENLEYLNLRGNPLRSDRLAVESLRRRFGKRVRV
jgi:uncharacterized protein (TIGR02996 family)